jgi:hypothetical protein
MRDWTILNPLSCNNLLNNFLIFHFFPLHRFNWLLQWKWKNEFKYSLYAAENEKVKRMKLNEAYIKSPSNSYPHLIFITLYVYLPLHFFACLVATRHSFTEHFFPSTHPEPDFVLANVFPNFCARFVWCIKTNWFNWN